MENGEEFLISFLEPKYAYYDITFENFNPINQDALVIHRKELESKNKEKNADRYKRISFESIAAFNSKSNRRTERVENEAIKSLKVNMQQSLSEGNSTSAKSYLDKILQEFSGHFLTKW